MLKPLQRINNKTVMCLHRHVHEAHLWAYTSESGGHMAQVGKPGMYDDYTEWNCPGRDEVYVSPPPPRPPTKDAVINDYAEKIQAVIDNGTIGDYTWQGLLVTFAQEWDKAR